MSRRSFLVAVGILACLIIGGTGIVIVIVRHEPDWYVRAAVPPGPERAQLSRDFLEAASDLKGQIDNEREWGGKFTARQVNSYFEEGLIEQKLDAELLRGQFSAPRVAFEQNRLRLGFRYGKGIWSTVISATLHVWVPKDDSSALVLELDSIHAGSLPVAAQSVLEEVSRVLREKDVEINWYRHNGHPCAVLRFQTEPQRSPVQLTAIQSNTDKEGMLVIQGRNNEIGPPTGEAAPGRND
jgi:hypothetical protein